MANPVPGHRITTPWRKRGRKWARGYHTGADYACPKGTRVVAAARGKVVAANWGGGGKGPSYGYCVVIQTGKYQALYAHLSRISVKRGQVVKAGELVGFSGATGKVTGPHLHFEVRRSPYRYGNDVNPRVLLAAKGGAPKPPRPRGGKVEVHWKELKYGQRNSDSVKALQRELNARVGAKLPITGNYLTKTKAAVARFQRSLGFSGSGADGLIYPGGRETTKRLFPASRFVIRW